MEWTRRDRRVDRGKQIAGCGAAALNSHSARYRNRCTTTYRPSDIRADGFSRASLRASPHLRFDLDEGNLLSRCSLQTT